MGDIGQGKVLQGACLVGGGQGARARATKLPILHGDRFGDASLSSVSLVV